MQLASRLKRDAVPQCFKAASETSRDAVPVSLVEVVLPQFLVRLLSTQDVVDDGEDRVSDSHSSAVRPTPRGDSVVLRAQISPAAAGGTRGFDQGASQPGATFASTATA